MSALFTEFTLKDITLRNRIAVPPMCQYSAIDGVVNDWHLAHYANLARGGAGLVIVEATAISPEGRISPGCAGLWSDDQIEGMAQIATGIKSAGSVPGIQIAHAGRKASANRPWEGDDHLAIDHPEAWETIAPSALAFGEHLSRTPTEMTLDDVQRVKQNFVDAAKRALAAGFEWLELHFAHGYLAQNFYSVHSNQRTDQYGGDLDGRSRFMLETLAAVREVWPENLPLTIRFGVVEYDGDDERMLPESIQTVQRFKELGTDFISVSIGFNTPKADIPWKPGFLAPVSQQIRTETGLPVATAWGVDSPELANRVIENDQIDVVMVGRAHLENSNWPYFASKRLGVNKPAWVLPPQYAHWLERYTPVES